MPLQRRVPKFGFKNPNRVEYKGINLDTLQELIDRKKLKAVTLKTSWKTASPESVIWSRSSDEGIEDGCTRNSTQIFASAKAAIEGSGGEATEA